MKQSEKGSFSLRTCSVSNEIQLSGSRLSRYFKTHLDGKWFPLTAEERYSAMPVWNNKFGKWACRFCEQSDFTEEDDVRDLVINYLKLKILVHLFVFWF